MAFIGAAVTGVRARSIGAACARAQRVQSRSVHAARSLQMAEIVKGVSFNTVAREWRFKWSTDNDKASLAKAQEVLDEVLPTLKALPGVKDVTRVVCGGEFVQSRSLRKWQ